MWWEATRRLDDDRLAAGSTEGYPHPMCRSITREQQLEGWRSFIDLLRGLKPNIGGILAALTAGHSYRSRL